MHLIRVNKLASKYAAKQKNIPRIINSKNINSKVLECYNEVFEDTPAFLRPLFESKTRIYSSLLGYNSKNRATIFINHIFYKSKKSIIALIQHEKRHSWQHIIIMRRKAGIVGIKKLFREINKNSEMTPFAKRFYKKAVRKLGPITDEMPLAKFADELIEAELKNPTRELNITSPPSFLKSLKIMFTTNPFSYRSNLLEEDANNYVKLKNTRVA